jgi:hypothetical protein
MILSSKLGDNPQAKPSGFATQFKKTGNPANAGGTEFSLSYHYREFRCKVKSNCSYF